MTEITPPNLTIYMVDTNVFRYSAYKIGDTSSDEEAQRNQHKQNAKDFFFKATVESLNSEALIKISEETKQELKVQAHTLKKESKAYNKIIENVEVEETQVLKELEYKLRYFSNYVRGAYSNQLVPSGRKTDYLQASDALIFVHAYLNDAVIVTANIKDFFLYPLFFEEDEDDVLYDIASRQYMKLLPSGRKLLESDFKFLELQELMEQLKYN